MSTKIFTPREAALQVLKKAEELYKSSSLAKGDWAKIHSKLKREGYSEESADKIDGAIKAKMNKSDEQGNNPDEKADADLGEKVEQDVQQHEESNEDPAHAKPEMKGHIKLAKFMGRMEHKKGQKSKEMDKAETGHEKGVHTAIGGTDKAGAGMSNAGADARAGTQNARINDSSGRAMNSAKSQHKQVLDQIHQMTKPKLPG
jgi:hypothetical protein